MDAVLRTIDLYGPFWLVSSFWILLAGAVALLAGRRGLNPFLWFVVGLVASPLSTLILLALITPRGGGQPPA